MTLAEDKLGKKKCVVGSGRGNGKWEYILSQWVVCDTHTHTHTFDTVKIEKIENRNHNSTCVFILSKIVKLQVTEIIGP